MLNWQRAWPAAADRGTLTRELTCIRWEAGNWRNYSQEFPHLDMETPGSEKNKSKEKQTKVLYNPSISATKKYSFKSEELIVAFGMHQTCLGSVTDVISVQPNLAVWPRESEENTQVLFPSLTNQCLLLVVCLVWHYCLFLVFLGKGIEPRALFMLSKHSTLSYTVLLTQVSAGFLTPTATSRYHLGALVLWLWHCPLSWGTVRP